MRWFLSLYKEEGGFTISTLGQYDKGIIAKFPFTPKGAAALGAWFWENGQKLSYMGSSSVDFPGDTYSKSHVNRMYAHGRHWETLVQAGFLAAANRDGYEVIFDNESDTLL